MMHYKTNSYDLLKELLSEAPAGDACMEWPRGCCDGPGSYGRVRVNGIDQQAHRVAYELRLGHIPAGLRVLHKCDNPPCFRPDHLFLGTDGDNVRDCMAKGRNPRGVASIGELNPSAKLNASQVLDIRRLSSEGWSYRRLAAHFNVTDGLVWLILKRRNWKHI